MNIHWLPLPVSRCLSQRPVGVVRGVISIEVEEDISMQSAADGGASSGVAPEQRQIRFPRCRSLADRD